MATLVACADAGAFQQTDKSTTRAAGRFNFLIIDNPLADSIDLNLRLLHACPLPGLAWPAQATGKEDNGIMNIGASFGYFCK
jgi:hypothetical protein